VDNDTLISIEGVRNWCSRKGIDESRITLFHDEAFLTCVSRLVQSLHVEELCPTERVQDEFGMPNLLLGPIICPLDAKALYGILQLIAAPFLVDAIGNKVLRTADALLDALCPVFLQHHESATFDTLASDFRNSLANLILNLALKDLLEMSQQNTFEPVYRGHSHYPFPSLRRGPSIDDVATASNLSPSPVSLPLFQVGGCRFHSIVFSDPGFCQEEWSSIPALDKGVLLPVHPWHIKLSPIVKELLRSGFVSKHSESIDAMPLASQRTCRVLTTLYDLKMPLDAIITGERRLLHRLNSFNAPFVSALVREIHRFASIDNISFQFDTASLCWDDPSLANHLSLIIRQPCPHPEGDIIIPALNLWDSVGTAACFFPLTQRTDVLTFFVRYCEALMTGPLLFCADWGLFFEPHMQNVFVVLRDGVLLSIILRDLDSTVLDRTRTADLCKTYEIPLAKDTWDYMPYPEIGQARLLHALFHGHLHQVMFRLLQETDVKLEELEDCIAQTWQTILQRAESPLRIRNLKAQSKIIRCSLSMRLKKSYEMVFCRGDVDDLIVG
jgi:hypothetical protein